MLLDHALDSEALLEASAVEADAIGVTSDLSRSFRPLPRSMAEPRPLPAGPPSRSDAMAELRSCSEATIVRLRELNQRLHDMCVQVRRARARLADGEATGPSGVP
jgi:hypothetical protein